MNEADAATQLRETGVALLRGAFAPDVLTGLRDVAARCFEAVETDDSLAERYQFNCFSHSVPLPALADFGCDSAQLLVPLTVPELTLLFSEAMGDNWDCRMEQSWVRKKFAPIQTPGRPYHLQGWHQDGALGVQFPSEPGPALPMTELLTCWIPLQACGGDRPGLEFVRGRQASLLHFTDLDDAAVRRRFAEREFYTPVLAFGDGLVFLNSVLHRTYVCEEMQRDRVSVEYRIGARNGTLRLTERQVDDFDGERRNGVLPSLAGNGDR
jgi:hypothetical protein